MSTDVLALIIENWILRKYYCRLFKILVDSYFGRLNSFIKFRNQIPLQTHDVATT